MSFRLPSLVKLPKHKSFDYIPRYYDPEKEERDELVKRRQQLQQLSEDKTGLAAKTNIHNLYDRHRRKYQKQSSATSNIRLVIIILGLLLFSYFVFIY